MILWYPIYLLVGVSFHQLWIQINEPQPWTRGIRSVTDVAFMGIHWSIAASSPVPTLVQMKLLHLEPNDMTTTLLSRGRDMVGLGGE